MRLTILGSSSATPTLNRHQTALALSYGSENYLLDCGEGAQMQMLRHGINQHKIRKVLISHLHPDHFTGLIGFITTQSLQRREKPLHIYGPSGIQTIIETQLNQSGARLSFPLYFHSLDSIEDGQIVFRDDRLQLRAFHLNHGIPCYGFLFTEQNQRYKLDKHRVQLYPPPVEAFSYLQRGEDYWDEKGRRFKASTYILMQPVNRSFAYITDTLVQYKLMDWFYKIDLLYHEATFTSELQERARKTYHTTSKEAAKFAKSSKAQKLVIGHFSARYQNLMPLLEEARTIFAETELGEEGRIFEI